MKTINKFLTLIFASVLLFSCTEDDNFFVATPTNEFTITTEAPASAINLQQENVQLTAYTMVWSAAEYSAQTPVSYNVELAATDDFASPVVAATTSNLYYSWTFNELNNFANELGLEPFAEGVLYARVVASVGDQGSVPNITANTSQLTVIPFVLYPFTDLFLVGSATEAGWDNNNNNHPLYRDPANEDVYSYTGYFRAGDFKMLTVLGQWQPQYGKGGANGSLGLNDGTGSDPDVISVATAGYYTLMVDLAANTYSLTAFDASTSMTFASVGIIGSATPTGWDSDTDLTATAENPHLWNLGSITLNKDLEVKFRANNAWDNNWGANTAFSGTAVGNGPNIPITLSGDYKVWFNDLTGKYSLIPAL